MREYSTQQGLKATVQRMSVRWGTQYARFVPWVHRICEQVEDGMLEQRVFAKKNKQVDFRTGTCSYFTNTTHIECQTRTARELVHARTHLYNLRDTKTSTAAMQTASWPMHLSVLSAPPSSARHHHLQQPLHPDQDDSPLPPGSQIREQ